VEDIDFGNNHSPIGDDDIASSITLSGQAVIKKSNEFAKIFLQERSKQSDDYFKHNDPIVYNDTDSFLGDTSINTLDGILRVEDMWNSNTSDVIISEHGHEMKLCDISVHTYDKDTNVDRFMQTKRLFRHKVNKRLFKIKSANGKEVTITEDHGLMVMRDNNLIRISPLEKIPGDMVITTTFD
jgi:hypothetical protein